MASTPEYAAPALDKGLDILELLAHTSGALSQTEIAEALSRSTGQIFRVLSTLERRGYVFRDKQSGLYMLAMKLFDLAHRHPPLRGLVNAAMPILQELAEKSRQSCNIAVLDGAEVRVIAQVESPADFGFRVRVGAAFDVATTATGAVLTAQSSNSSEAQLYTDTLQPGIADIVAPVRDSSGAVVAALTVPYIATTFSDVDPNHVQKLVSTAAEQISLVIAAESRSENYIEP